MYQKGKWYVICDVCGFKFYNTETKKRWDGLITCHSCWEPDHPQKFVRVEPDGQGVPNPRPEQPDQFVNVPYIG